MQTIDSDQTLRVKIDPQVVLKKLKELRISKLPGPDRLCPRVLIETTDLIAESLSMIFQKSLQSNELPSIWKKATVIPLHKKENCLDPLNYCPISLTCMTTSLSTCTKER